MGVATQRKLERSLASQGLLYGATPLFEPNQDVSGAGVLVMLPALISEGLLQTTKHYKCNDPHYYTVESIILTLAFMFLARIKNPEQLKNCKPGELGKWIGLDRIPEVKRLREKIYDFINQSKAIDLNITLIKHWYNLPNEEQDLFYYVDGHQRIYYGSQANLPTKFISRLKLCLSATTEYWVNDVKGMPMLFTLGELSEKLQQIIEQQIIPQLIQSGILSQSPIQEEDQTPRLTLIFDREAYEPSFFIRIWQLYRIAIITYRKNVKDLWAENSFQKTTTKDGVTVLLCEQEVSLNNHTFREIRKQSTTSHQTAIITTHPTLKMEDTAEKMFNRWSQENFFKYMIADYDFDKMIEYGIEDIDPEKTIVNPEYRKINSELKKLVEKKRRIEVKFYPIVDKLLDETIDQVPKISNKLQEYQLEIAKYDAEIEELKSKRKETPPKIQLKEIPEDKRTNKLKTESKMLMNILKMICYRAETAVCSLIAPYFKKYDDEKRMFVKQLIKNNADIIPEMANKRIIINLHSLSTPRYNEAIKKLCEALNETETQFPATNLTLFFKTSF